MARSVTGEEDYLRHKVLYEKALQEGNDEQALTSCKTMKACSRQLNETTQTWATLQLGMIYYRVGNLAKAKEHLTAAKPAIENLNNSDEIKRILVLNLVHSLIGEYEAARTLLKQALNALDMLISKERAPLSELYEEAMGYYYLETDRKKAKTYFQLSLQKKRQRYGDQSPFVAEAYSHLALACDNFNEAKKHLESTGTILLARHENNEHADIADYCWHVGKIMLHFGKIKTAKAYLLECLRIRKKIIPNRFYPHHYKATQIQQLIETHFQINPYTTIISPMDRDTLSSTLNAETMPISYASIGSNRYVLFTAAAASIVSTAVLGAALYSLGRSPT